MNGVHGGYDYEFVDTPLDILICKICYYPSREPYLSDCCGHTFCKSCLRGYEVSVKHPLNKELESSGHCPMCRCEDFTCVRNRQSERIIKNLRVFCTNKNDGCRWQGEINNIDKHLTEECQYQMVDCPNNCGKAVQKQFFINHVKNACIRRSVNCSFCCSLGEHHFIEGQHKHYCPKFPMTCPNECGTSLLREEIDKHRKICPLEKVNCPNNCGISLLQQHLNKHIMSECPCRIVNCQHCLTSGECQHIEGEHKEHCTKFPIPCPNKCEVDAIPREELQRHLDTICPLQVIQCEYHILGCAVQVTRKDLEKHMKEQMKNHLSLTTQQLAKVQVILNKTAAMLNGTITEFHTRITEVEVAAQSKIDKLENKLQIQANVLEALVGGWTYRIYSEAMNQSRGIVPLIVRTPRVMINEEVWTSNPFFTHFEGYKIKLSVKPVRMAFGLLAHLISYFSLSINLMDGPYDNNLPWPMNGMLKITLLNQVRDVEHHPPVIVTYAHGNPVNHGEIEQIGFIKNFIAREKFYRCNEACQFVKYNAMVFQVDVV